jgi:PadR family transcriptional regulator, regulatory protein AphA
LSESSYVVLGLVRDGPGSSSYDLKRMVAVSVGYFWDFPHSQLYAEPNRLAELGLLEPHQEDTGRRRRTYTITDAGRAALDAWLDDPTTDDTEVRDAGLLKLFFATGRDDEQIRRLAEVQAKAHAAHLAEYEALEARIRDLAPPAQLRTLELGMRFERLCVDFWEEVADAPPR